MDAKELHQLGWQPDDPAVVSRLCVAGVGPDLQAVRAVAGAVPAAAPAAPVLVPRPVAAPPDGERAGVEVDVRPAKAERFAGRSDRLRTTAPAHEAHDGAVRDAEQEEDRGCGVAGVVEAGASRTPAAVRSAFHSS